VIAQVDRLNKDFRKLNPDSVNINPFFKPLHADCEIEFRLAQLDPDGNCTNGIERIYSHRTLDAGQFSKLNKWPREKYLNVWVITNIPSDGAGTTLAYAHFPSDVDGPLAPFDGIIMMSNQCNGSSSTLTHEIGHYLALEHTWGSTNSPEVACGDDNVGDTPETMGHFSTCPAFDSTCTPGVLENIQNYMDYSSCTFMFTHGQKDRMRAALESPIAQRNNLWTAANLAATGVDGSGTPCAPIADFYSNKYMVCPGGSVTFTRNVMNTTAAGGTLSYLWEFPGSNTPTSTSSAATVNAVYPTEGWYPVTLTVTNSVGNHSTTKTDFVKVGPEAAFYYGISQENFENTANYFYAWNVRNYDVGEFGSNTWGLSSSAGTSGTHSVFMTGYNNFHKDVDDLISPPFNLMGLTGATMTFKCAAASRATSVAQMTEQLKVYSSIDCGATWQLRKTFPAVATSSGSPYLINAGYHPEYFVPSAGDWMTQTVTIPASIVTDNTRFKFEYTSSDLGNNVYIDDINILGTVGINEEVIDENAISIYPNPASEFSTLAYHLNEKAQVTVQLVDILGKQVTSINSTQTEGDYKVNFSKEELGLKNGIYFVKLTVNNNTITRKLVITQ
jgi:PKD repeat protein